MLAEISKVTLGLIYDRTMKKGTAESRNNFLNEHILVFDSTKGNLEEAIKNKWKDKETGKEMNWNIVVGNPPYGKGQSEIHLRIMDTILGFCDEANRFFFFGFISSLLSE